MSGEAFPDLSEQIRLELERITRGRVLNFDDDDEEEECIQLSAQLDGEQLTLTSSALPQDWGKEIVLNGVRFRPILNAKANVSTPVASPSSRNAPASPKEHKAPPPPPPPPPADKENFGPVEQPVVMHRRKSQDLTNQIEDLSSGFLAKLTRHGTYVDRWCELDVPNKCFQYWKTRAARGTVAPTVVPISEVVSVQYNAKDIKEGKRRNMIGIGGARFVIVTSQKSTTWRAKDPLLAIRWIDGIQDLIEQVHAANGERGLQAGSALEEKFGPLQRMNKAGRYKDRWCQVDFKNHTLSYWGKKTHWEAKRAPKGVVNFAEVSTIVWNPEDVRKGKRRSLLTKDGVRFSLHFADQSVQQWRTDNPLDASEWSRALGAVHCKVLARLPAVGKA